MALMDLLSALLGGGQSQQQTGVDPGQSVSGKSMGNMPMSQLIQQQQQQSQQQAAPTSVSGLTVAPQPGSAGPMINAPPVTTPAPVNMQGSAPAGAPLADPMGKLVGQQTPQGPTLNYNNSPSVEAVNKQDQANMPTQINSGNPGLYGLLPANLQHGVLRNTLGAIGDAMLVTSHMQPSYANGMSNAAVGNAMAGMDINDPQSVSAAAQRIAATGAPGAAKMADTVTQQGEQAQLRQQYMQYNQNYREQVVGERNQNIIRQMAPQMQQYLSAATSQADYKQRLSYAQSRMTAIDPKLDATAELGVPSADDWKPGMLNSMGMTNNQVTQHDDRLSGQADTRRGQDLGYAGKINSAKIYAASRPGRGPTQVDEDNQLATEYNNSQNGGPPMSPADTFRFNKRFGTGRNETLPIPERNGRSAFAGLPSIERNPASEQSGYQAMGNAFGSVAPAPKAPSFRNGAVYTDAHGNSARYQNGRWLPVKR